MAINISNTIDVIAKYNGSAKILDNADIPLYPLLRFKFSEWDNHTITFIGGSF